ncbi:winged helix-turn-helix transcriptional regulator [Candidatus Pacearchaeota archaeon]|nr:winged helix-turn-helix transcriptional regulator [Candidatus Pacearchaeota archaeon]
MTKIDILKLKNVFSALANEKRIRIIELCSQKGRTVTELSKLLKLNYSITVEYTSMLAKVNLVEKKRNKDRTVSVKSLIKLNNCGEIKKI